MREWIYRQTRVRPSIDRAFGALTWLVAIFLLSNLDIEAGWDWVRALALGCVIWLGLTNARLEGQRKASEIDTAFMKAFGWECFKRGTEWERGHVKQALDEAAFELIMEQHRPTKNSPPS